MNTNYITVPFPSEDFDHSDLPAGKFEAKIVVKVDNISLSSRTITLRVYDFAIGEEVEGDDEEDNGDYDEKEAVGGIVEVVELIKNKRLADEEED